jgi:hypothetical protein
VPEHDADRRFVFNDRNALCHVFLQSTHATICHITPVHCHATVHVTAHWIVQIFSMPTGELRCDDPFQS